VNALIDAAFDRSRTVLLLLIFLVLSGALAYKAIPKESEPDVPIPIVYVSMTHDGISPADAERLLVRPMEKQLQTITGIKDMSSTASEGRASVLLEFDAGFDGDQALADVREKVDVAKSELPAATDEPSVNEVNVSLFPVLNVSLSGPIPERALTAIARELKDALEALPGVLEADIAGEREEVLEVVVDPLVMESYSVDFAEVISLVANNNLLVAAGSIDTGAGRLVLKVPGVIEDINDILGLPVKVTGDAIVRFGDVASVRRTYKDPTSFARLDGQPTLVLEISKRLGANIIETIEQVRETIEAARPALPGNLEIGFHQDKSEETRTMLADLQNNVVSGVVLVMIVIMATLGVRSAVLVGFAIPGSFLTGILVIWAMGNTMNVVVLFSLILVVGMLVDGAIVVTELADRNMNEGATPRAAWAQASKRMSWPVIASTFTTLAVFFPLLFWPGLIGQFMRYMPITVIACLLASLAMALIFVPVIGAKLSRGAVLDAASFSEDKDVSDVRPVHIVARAQGAKRWYLSQLYRMLIHPWITLLAVLLFTAGSYALYSKVGRGVEFFPSVEPVSMAISVAARGDLSIYEQDRVLQTVEQRLLDHDEIKSIYTRTGSGASALGGGSADQIGTVTVEFIDWSLRRKAAVIAEELRESLADIAGVRIEFVANEGGPDGGAKPVNLQVSVDPVRAGVSGAALDARLGESVVALREAMVRVGGFIDVTDNRPLPGIEWRLEVDREEAALFGANVALIGQAIQMVTSGIRIAGYRPDDANDELDIRVRYPLESRHLDSIAEIRVSTRRGMVPLTNFVRIEPGARTGTIERVGGDRTVTVAADVAEGEIADTQLRLLQDDIASTPLPDGARVVFAGEAEEQAETMNFLMLAFLSAIFLMTMILVTQFNSLYQAALVLSAILFSTSGVLIGLMVTGQTFGIVMVGIGIIALAGIVVNNNIVLIDTWNGFRAQGAGAVEASLLTGYVRARPVLLTAITTVLGLMPMVLAMNIDLINRSISFGAPSTQWWTQLASAIAGGLAFTTLLTLFLTPCLLVLGVRSSKRSRLAWIPRAIKSSLARRSTL
jgi:multidrug efflux pump